MYAGKSSAFFISWPSQPVGMRKLALAACPQQEQKHPLVYNVALRMMMAW